MWRAPRARKIRLPCSSRRFFSKATMCASPTMSPADGGRPCAASKLSHHLHSAVLGCAVKQNKQRRASAAAARPHRLIESSSTSPAARAASDLSTFCGKSRHVPVLPLENSVSDMAARDTTPSAACAASLVRVEFDRGVGAGARLVHEGQLLRRAAVDGFVDENVHGAEGVERVGEAEQRCAVVSNGEPHLHAHTKRDKDVTYISAHSDLLE